jgi:hypothetical protein
MQPSREPAILDLLPTDIPAVLALNNAHAVETSMLDEPGLAELLNCAFYARGIDGGVNGFLLAMDHRAPYANQNSIWFKKRRSSFVYIDRVIVAESSGGQGLGTKLYLDLIRAAYDAGHDSLACEVNIDPPNPGSEAFHAAMGFSVIGEATIHDGKKQSNILRNSWDNEQ